MRISTDILARIVNQDIVGFLTRKIATKRISLDRPILARRFANEALLGSVSKEDVGLSEPFFFRNF